MFTDKEDIPRKEDRRQNKEAEIHYLKNIIKGDRKDVGASTEQENTIFRKST